jgi:hypothetical protein
MDREPVPGPFFVCAALTHDAPFDAGHWWVRLLPFSDAASHDLPLSRLMRLALFQVSVGMALVLLIGTLNRVMIVELERCPHRWWV